MTNPTNELRVGLRDLQKYIDILLPEIVRADEVGGGIIDVDSLRVLSQFCGRVLYAAGSMPAQGSKA